MIDFTALVVSLIVGAIVAAAFLWHRRRNNSISTPQQPAQRKSTSKVPSADLHERPTAPAASAPSNAPKVTPSHAQLLATARALPPEQQQWEDLKGLRAALRAARPDWRVRRTAVRDVAEEATKGAPMRVPLLISDAAALERLRRARKEPCVEVRGKDTVTSAVRALLEECCCAFRAVVITDSSGTQIREDSTFEEAAAVVAEGPGSERLTLTVELDKWHSWEDVAAALADLHAHLTLEDVLSRAAGTRGKMKMATYSVGRAVVRDLNLQHMGLQALPDCFCELAISGELRLQRNQLRALPAKFGSLVVGGRPEMSNDPTTANGRRS